MVDEGKNRVDERLIVAGRGDDRAETAHSGADIPWSRSLAVRIHDGEVFPIGDVTPPELGAAQGSYRFRTPWTATRTDQATATRRG